MSRPTEALEHFYAAINRNDLQSITRDFDPDIVRIEPEGFPTAGTYRGIAEVQAHVAHGRGTWAEGTCEPEKYLENGDKVVVFLHAHVRLRNTRNGWADGLPMASCFATAGSSNTCLSASAPKRWPGPASRRVKGAAPCLRTNRRW